MTKEELWDELTRRNPQFTNGQVTFANHKTFRKFYDLVWDQASKYTATARGLDADVPDFLSDLFKMTGKQPK
jgi:hypothetical protein